MTASTDPSLPSDPHANRHGLAEVSGEWRLASVGGQTDGWHEQLCRRLWNGDEELGHLDLLQLLGSHTLPYALVPAVSQRLLEEFSSLGHIFGAPNERLQRLLYDAGRLSELIKTVNALVSSLLREPVAGKPLISSQSSLLDYLKITLGTSPIEIVRILYLDRKNFLIKDELHSRGTVDHVPFYPREVVRRVLDLGACAIILVHNHPSGDPEPSKADIRMTFDLHAVLKAIQVSLHDHVIVGRSGYVSFRQTKLLTD